jgi:predicted DNA-binding ribbon-helix-helix protein
MSIVKHSVVVGDRKTSISLKAPFWDALKAIAKTAGKTVAEAVTEIDAGRGGANLSSAIRLAVLAHYRGA